MRVFGLLLLLVKLMREGRGVIDNFNSLIHSKMKV